MKKLLWWTVAALWPLMSFSQDSLQVVRMHKQQKFRKTVAAGNYSGIANLGDGRFAVVSDKSEEDGFFVFQIVQDPVTGKIVRVADEGFRSSGKPNRDMEGIAYVPQTGTLFISGEAGNEVLEYSLDGRHTGRRLAVPDVFRTARAGYGLEALTYDADRHLFWVMPEQGTMCEEGGSRYEGGGRKDEGRRRKDEGYTRKEEGQTTKRPNDQRTRCNGRNRLRLQCFGDDLQAREHYFYVLDEPQARGWTKEEGRRRKEDGQTTKGRGAMDVRGVSALCAVGDGRLIVLEREVFVSKRKIGSWVHCKLYVVNPPASAVGGLLEKRLLTEFRTKLNLIRQNFANYEGLCWGADLTDGCRTLLLIADSQNQYKGILRDWLKVLVIDKNKKIKE